MTNDEYSPVHKFDCSWVNIIHTIYSETAKVQWCNDSFTIQFKI